MPLWTRKKNRPQQTDVTEVLYLSDEAEAQNAVLSTRTTTCAATGARLAHRDEPAVSLIIPETEAVDPVAAASADCDVNASDECEKSFSTRLVPTLDGAPVTGIVPNIDAPGAKPGRDPGKADKHKRGKDQKPPDVDSWRRGIKGRPSQVFIGFLANASKKDAAKYAIGVAGQNALNPVNSSYAVFQWNGGWAYEVHEGGPMRAYLPSILRFFEAHPDGKHDEFVITISTSGRSVRVERTHNGITAFMMPESFTGKQTEWLDPGVKLKPAVPVRMGVLAAGGVIFATGFLAMMLALAKRPEPALLPKVRFEVPFDQLPMSQWTQLTNISANNYVDALEFSKGTWNIQRAVAQDSSVATPPPPLPAPAPRKP